MSISYICTELTEGFVSIASECECEEECGGCEICQQYCETTCELSCQDCQDRCENYCQYACENYCMTDCESCETACMGTCLDACQVCENQCQTNCQIICEETCLGTCEDTCESVFQGTAPPAPSSPPSLDYRFEGGIALSWPMVENAESYVVKFRDTEIGSVTTLSESLNYCSFSGTYGRTYAVSVKAINTYGESSYTSENLSTIAPQTPNIGLVDMVDGITVSSNTPSGNWSGVEFYVYDENNTLLGTKQAANPNTTVTFNILGIKSILARSYLYVNNTTLYSVNYSNELTLGRPLDWEWSYNIVSGGEMLLLSESQDGKLHAYILTHTEWNNFTERINEFRFYKQVGEFIFTTVQSEDDFTLEIINDAIEAINGMGFSIPKLIYTDIYASTFIVMRDTLNSVQ